MRIGEGGRVGREGRGRVGGGGQLSCEYLLQTTQKCP